jgi:hypothetical protein
MPSGQRDVKDAPPITEYGFDESPLLWLEHFGYDPGDPTKQFWKESQSVWFDDVVVATDYIGPIKKVTRDSSAYYPNH